jgi:hypothetical protein
MSSLLKSLQARFSRLRTPGPLRKYEKEVLRLRILMQVLQI